MAQNVLLAMVMPYNVDLQVNLTRLGVAQYLIDGSDGIVVSGYRKSPVKSKSKITAI